jgi:ABC-type nitrate/sulfonate/bicarbonate transport system substrate-binding protein
MQKTVAAVVAAAGILGAAGAAAQTKLDLILFAGGSALPVYAAEDKGFFAKQGLEVTVTPTPNSIFQMQNLVGGKFQIAQSALDNYIAYQEGQGAAPLPKEPDLVVFLSGALVDLPVYVTPDIKSYADLKGQPIGVDALTTGFAFALFKMLEKGGLGAGDYQVLSVGGTAERLQSMKDGKVKAAVLNEPFDALGRQAGMRELTSSVKALGPYQGTCFGADRAWVKANKASVVAFARAYLDAVDWLYEPGNRKEAGAILAKRLTRLSPEAAERTVAASTDASAPSHISRDGSLDADGIKTVIALRNEYGRPQKTLGDVSRYVDLSYWEEAKRTRK